MITKYDHDATTREMFGRPRRYNGQAFWGKRFQTHSRASVSALQGHLWQCNIGALIIRIGFWGGWDIRLRRTKLEMTCASIECVAAYEKQLRKFEPHVINVSQHGVIF